MAISGSPHVTSLMRATSLSQCDGVRPLLAGDHGGAEQELPRALGVLGNPAQLVEISRPYLRIALLEPLLVRDRLLLNEFNRDRTPLQVVEIEQSIRLGVQQDAAQLAGEIDGILDAAVEPHAA